jgi:hypothetical protein
MRKLALTLTAALLVTLAGSKPAEAHCRTDCPVWIDVLGWAFVAGVVGGYAYGTGYYVYHDATDEAQTLNYAAGELTANALLGTLFAAGAVGAGKDGHGGAAVGLGAIALAHGALAAHGVGRIYEHRSEMRLPDETLAWAAGIAYAANAIAWASQLPADRGRGYGIAEAAVNLPLAAGLGYLAVDRAQGGGDMKHVVLFGGMAALSGAFVYHGVRTAISPKRRSALDLGPDIAPTVVTDGFALAPGLGASGTW